MFIFIQFGETVFVLYVTSKHDFSQTFDFNLNGFLFFWQKCICGLKYVDGKHLKINQLVDLQTIFGVQIFVYAFGK